MTTSSTRPAKESNPKRESPIWTVVSKINEIWLMTNCINCQAQAQHLGQLQSGKKQNAEESPIDIGHWTLDIGHWTLTFDIDIMILTSWHWHHDIDIMTLTSWHWHHDFITLTSADIFEQRLDFWLLHLLTTTHGTTWDSLGFQAYWNFVREYANILRQELWKTLCKYFYPDLYDGLEEAKYRKSYLDQPSWDDVDRFDDIEMDRKFTWI